MSPAVRRAAFCVALAAAFLAGVLVSRQQPAAGQAPGKAPAWEYKAAEYDPTPGALPQSFTKELNAAAADGWEFVGVYGPEKHLPLSVFKRQKK
jgi:hypothetical protein